jgi:L-asparaginase / beta-aspartyl-peptidase
MPARCRHKKLDMHALVIHAGAGVISQRLAAHPEARFKESLGRILDAGFAVLERGGCALDSVTEAVRMLEDDPLFNAGRGAGLTSEGTAELDASIMDGHSQKAGAVACVTRVKNPVELARRVMEASSHVMLVGRGADEFALKQRLTLVPNEYFHTDERRMELELAKRGEYAGGHVPTPHGTVGAVAYDSEGHLAAATSTGGTTNKLPGRVGDSPIIGAGTYAKDGVCGVSATGYGEYFMRTVAAHHLAAAIEYRELSLKDAARELIHQTIPQLGGNGGIIAIDAAGRMVLEFNTEGMFRGARDSNGQRVVAIR